MSSNMFYLEAYGKWAGNPKGHKPDYTKCCVEVSGGAGYGRMFSTRQCSGKRGHGPGMAYCSKHDPEAVKAREAKSQAVWMRKANALRYQTHGPEFYEALKQIADGHNDARGLAKKIIKEFKAGEWK
jgi:hypothetical protein